MPPKRKQNGGNRIHYEVKELEVGLKKQRALDASKGLTAYHEMCDRNQELEVRHV